MPVPIVSRTIHKAHISNDVMYAEFQIQEIVPTKMIRIPRPQPRKSPTLINKPQNPNRPHRLPLRKGRIQRRRRQPHVRILRLGRFGLVHHEFNLGVQFR